MPFLQSIRLSGLLSFPPDSDSIRLSGLNVLIGPNGSGKSNLIEAIELLHAMPTGFAAAIREGGGVREWLWKGEPNAEMANLEFASQMGTHEILKHFFSFTPAGNRFEIVHEELLSHLTSRGRVVASELYKSQRGKASIGVRNQTPHRRGILERKELSWGSLSPDESILSQRKDADAYPELAWLANRYSRIQAFREWTFGRSSNLRLPQRTDLPDDALLPDSSNLALILNSIEHSGGSLEFNQLLRQYLPRYERFSTRIQGGTVQLYLHETGLQSPIPATRLSDGTLRFMAMLALLLSPSPPPLVCLEEPELGLHPDAVTLLADVLAEASKRMQLVVTTHADELVSALTEHAESILVCEYRDGTIVRRVEPERVQHWLDQYRLGEIWRIGELGGNP